jgi:Protein of unknown function (DUF3306)
MTDSDHSDDDKGFLKRWSQRKQEAKQPEPKPDAPAAEAAAPPAGDVQTDAAPEFDLSSLPKLDELTGSTDITAFLRKGVPEHLRNAALRKSWALDPAIRNYVNPALEYAYDWNTPGGVPGSGELGAGVDVARMVSQIMGGGSPGEAAAAANETANASANAAQPLSQDDATQDTQPELPTQALRLGNEAVSDNSDDRHGGAVAEPAPKSDARESAAPQQPVRRHGSAKPTV